MIKIYTDGACSGNPGTGGWGVVILENNKDAILLNGGNDNTTNNRMELQAAIEALKYFKDQQDIIIVTDSKYVKDGIQSWIQKLEKKWLEDCCKKTSKK